MWLKKYKNLSVRKKLLISMLSLSILLVVSVTVTAMYFTYHTMRKQLIYDHRLSAGWLRDRLGLEVQNYMKQFYEFEVNKEMKADILGWCRPGGSLDYTAQLRLITGLNEAISMESGLNSMEIYNPITDEVLAAERSGAAVEPAGDRFDQWNGRDGALQTNLVFFRNEKEITAVHQTYNFYDSKPVALITMQIRPYGLQEILEGIKSIDEETIVIFNDQYELIEADYGNGSFSEGQLADILRVLQKSDSQEVYWDGAFWFYRPAAGGKLNILVSVPGGTITAALSSTLIAGLVIAGLAVVISILSSILFSRAFSRPIINLSARMRTMTLDDCVQGGSPDSDRKDEIGVLNNSFGIMIERNQKLIAQEYQSKLEKRNAQIRALQAQINPHFMYNTLQVIGGMALKKQAPEIYGVTTALGDILRYSLNFSREMVCLREEIRYLQGYLLIQNERFGNRIQLQVDADKELSDYLIPKLILQPLLENSLEHGLSNKSGIWNIRLCCALSPDGALLLSVIDNGIGMTEDRLAEIRGMLKRDAENALKAASHIGLCNVDSRIRLIYPEYGYGITISSESGKGTTVTIRIKAVKGGKGYEEL